MSRVLYLWCRYGWIFWLALMVWAILEGSALPAAGAAVLAASNRASSRVYADEFEARRLRREARNEWVEARVIADQCRRYRDQLACAVERKDKAV